MPRIHRVRWFAAVGAVAGAMVGAILLTHRIYSLVSEAPEMTSWVITTCGGLFLGGIVFAVCTLNAARRRTVRLEEQLRRHKHSERFHLLVGGQVLSDALEELDPSLERLLKPWITTVAIEVGTDGVTVWSPGREKLVMVARFGASELDSPTPGWGFVGPARARSIQLPVRRMGVMQVINLVPVQLGSHRVQPASSRTCDLLLLRLRVIAMSKGTCADAH